MIRPARNTIIVGIGLILASVTLFSLNDAVGKWLVKGYPVGEMLLIRGPTALVLLAPFLWREGISVFTAAPRPGLQILRAVISTTEVVRFFWSVGYLPLADVMTFYLAGPIYVTALAPFVLGEHVGWRRWAAVLVGFAGVLLALKPSAAALTAPALVALTGSLLYAGLLIMTRVLRNTANVVLVSSQIAATALFGLAMAPFGWVTPRPGDFALMVLFGVLGRAGLVCLNMSLKRAPASVVVPYQYTMIVWGVVLGWFIFGDEPKAHVLAGAAVIIAAGMFIFFRENRRQTADDRGRTKASCP
ncbi:MAG: DMT family transporter [Hyphomicrobiales bacterium]|nr:DMT family transporter [Hyphomicrobiales bacterium]MBV8826399.1 DMT family transporter [Hyphomicrobiales bacterium]MBV9428517.1 DMT family transporter [Bradyrhizobiaceae bacterium]